MLGEYVALYQREYPPPSGRTIPTHFIPFDIDNEVPTEGEIEVVVRRLSRNRSGGHTHLLEEHLQAWLREAYPVNISTAPPQFNLMAETGRTNTVHVGEFSIPVYLGWTLLVH